MDICPNRAYIDHKTLEFESDTLIGMRFWGSSDGKNNMLHIGGGNFVTSSTTF